MKAKELISKLSKLNPELEVEIDVGEFRQIIDDDAKVCEIFYNEPSNKYILIDMSDK